jgi:hypothetical protein
MESISKVIAKSNTYEEIPEAKRAGNFLFETGKFSHAQPGKLAHYGPKPGINREIGLSNCAARNWGSESIRRNWGGIGVGVDLLRIGDRGRNAHYRAPPAQNRTAQIRQTAPTLSEGLVGRHIAGHLREVQTEAFSKTAAVLV